MTDKDGYYIILDITIENHQFSLLNLYGPNSNSPHSFDNLKEKLEVLPGDRNVEQNYVLNTVNYKQNK